MDLVIREFVEKYQNALMGKTVIVDGGRCPSPSASPGAGSHLANRKSLLEAG
jgi:hypothetical protein